MATNNHIHSDSKNYHSSLALLFTADNVRRYAIGKNNENDIYLPPISNDEEINTEEKIAKLKKKKDRLIVFVITVTVLNIIYGILETKAKGLTGAKFFGYAIGFLAIPITLLVVSQIIPLFRDNYIRLHVYFWPSAIIYAFKTLLIILAISGRL